MKEARREYTIDVVEALRWLASTASAGFAQDLLEHAVAEMEYLRAKVKELSDEPAE
jgi:hypothetical protein